MFNVKDYVLFRDSFGELYGHITCVEKNADGTVNHYEMDRPSMYGGTVVVYEDELTLLCASEAKINVKTAC